MPSSDDRFEQYRALGIWTDERLGWLLHQAALRWPDREFILFEGTRLTFDQLNAWVEHVGGVLLDRGVRPGDHLVVQLPNCLEAMVLQAAAFRIGVVVAPVVPIYRRHEMRHILGDLRPTAVAAATSYRDRRPAQEIDELIEELGLDPVVRLNVGEDIPDWTAVPPRPATPTDGSRSLPEPRAADQACVVLYTSGTTAAPKGALLSSQAILALVRSWRLSLELNSADVVLCVAPLSHLAGFLIGFILPVSLGGRTVLMPGWDPDRAAQLIAQERATFAGGATTFLTDLTSRYEQPDAPDYRLPKFFSGGAPTPVSVTERAHGVGISAFQAYGMTEVAGTCAMGHPDVPLPIRAAAVGRTCEGTEIEIVDDDHQGLPTGTAGHIRIRSAQMMLGYTDPEQTAAQLDADGWFYPGDLGVLDKAGYLRVTGRTKDIINRGGEKFSAQDIEAAIVSHESVAEAAVVGVPDDRFGEAVAAFVVLRQATNWQGGDELINHLDSLGMAKAKRPVEWHVVDHLPRTASGKIQKHELIEARNRRPPSAAGCL